MAEASGSLTFRDIYIEVCARKYSTRDWPTEAQIAAASWPDHTAAELETAEERIDEAKVIANLGYRTFLQGRDWAFLETVGNVTAWVDESSTANGAPVYDAAAYSAVTVDDADTFHASMIGHDLTFAATGNSYEIYSYTSGTVVNVVGDASGEADGDTVTVTADAVYRMPDDYAEPEGDWIFFQSGDQKVGLQKRDPAILRELLGRDSRTAENPWCWALEAVTSYGEGYQRYNIIVYPPFGSEETLSVPYRINQAELSAGTDYPLGGSKHAMTVLAAAMMALEEDSQNTSTKAHEKYNASLARSMRRDDEDRPRNLGYCGDMSDAPAVRRERGTVSYA